MYYNNKDELTYACGDTHMTLLTAKISKYNLYKSLINHILVNKTIYMYYYMGNLTMDFEKKWQKCYASRHIYMICHMQDLGHYLKGQGHILL